MLGKAFVLKTLLVLWLVSVVLVESAHQKRDVHHRIVLKEPRPMRNHRTKHNTKHYHGRHEENKPKKSKKKPHKPVDSFEKSEESFGFSPEETISYDEYIKKQTKSKRNQHSSHPHHHQSYASTSSHGSKYHPKVTYHFTESKEPPVTSFYEKEPSYIEHYQDKPSYNDHYQEKPSYNEHYKEKPSTLNHENFKENVHHFENVEQEYKGPNKWPGPLSSPGSDEYYVGATKEKSNENKQKPLPKNHKLHSSESFEYQQPSQKVMEYYKPVTSVPKRHTHNYEYDTSESNTYKPVSTSFQSFESNQKMMEASPLVGTMASFRPYTYSLADKKTEPSYKIENFSLRDVKENTKNPFKIVVDSFENTKENSENQESTQTEENRNRSKGKGKRPYKNRKQKEKSRSKTGPLHKIKKTVYD